jgi:hypothetical protein
LIRGEGRDPSFRRSGVSSNGDGLLTSVELVPRHYGPRLFAGETSEYAATDSSTLSDVEQDARVFLGAFFDPHEEANGFAPVDDAVVVGGAPPSSCS